MHALNTAAYDRLPISTFIYEPVLRGDGTPKDFRIVYANQVFARDWLAIYHNDRYVGACLRENTLMDDDSLGMMERFLTEPPHAFSTYMPMVRLHLHFEPMVDLPSPYAGFFLTNLTDYEEKDARTHFLRNISQMKNNAVLMRRQERGRLECVYVSDSFARMMECTVEEAMRMMDGTGFFHTTHPEDRPFERSILKRRVTDDGGSDLTIQKVTAKRGHIWCNVHYAFIDDFGEEYVYCTYTNVTVLKRYEERLRSVYTSLGSTFYQADDQTLGLFRVNLTKNSVEEMNGRDLFPSDSARLPYSELMARRAENYPIAAERERFLRTFDAERLSAGYLEGRVSAREVLYSRRRDGRDCFVEVYAALTRHPLTGHMIAFLTERECNADKVRETLMSKILAQQFDMVAYLVNGDYGVSIGDAAQVAKGGIFPVTRSGVYQEYLDKQVRPALHGSEQYCQQAMEALSLEAVESQTRLREPYVVNIAIAIEGEIFHKRFDFYTVSPQARFYIVLKSDTTELHREQAARNEQLRSALAEAQQANVAKTAFLSSMSHEIRTPMNAIIGLDNIALKDPDLPERTREHLEKIGGSARHLLGLINDILDMSRIESGRMTLSSEEFSFREMLEQINTMIGGQCQDRGLTYHCQVLGHISPYYIGDDMKLKQVLINILGNAVKFTPAPGSVTFQMQETARFEGQSTLRFVIRDTGIGMDKAYLPKLFEAFSQEDATTTNQYGGSGLGMAITKNIVEMMNGGITVDSEKGMGTTFTVDVTLRLSDREDTRETHPQDMRVLVIDDDPVSREHAKLVLDEIGVQADTAESGPEALEMVRVQHARREAYNLILVDLRMPVMDGVETTRRIRELIGGDTAVVLLTAHNWSDVEDAAKSAGVDSFLSKPLFASSVLYEFRKAMERRQSQAPEEPGKADLTGRRILLAEDMLINAEIMIELLEMMGMQVEHAENGQDAVDRFAESPEGHFDAVLMDMRMPVMDGLTAAKTIRALPRLDARKIPIIALTANAFDEDVQRSLQAGMNAHLSKPVEPERLYTTLAELIQA